MKLRLFLVISALVAIVYAVADPFLSGSPSTLPIWSVIVAVGAFIPAIIAFIAQKDSLKTFASDYLSLRKTDWRKAAIVLGATAILSPLLRLVIVGVFGNLLHVSFFGEFSRQFHVNYLGVISWYGSGVADTLMACAGDMVYQGFGSDHVCHLGCRVDVMDTCDDLCGHNVEQRSDASYL